MGGFAGFAQGLMGTIGPNLEQRRKERDEKNAELRKHYLTIAMTPGVPDEALQDAAKNLKKLGYDDKESQNVFQKVHGLFGKIKQSGQQQPQRGPIAPPGAAPKQDIALEGAAGPQPAEAQQRGPIQPPQVGGQAGSIVSGLQSAAKSQQSNIENAALSKFEGQKELLDARLENQLEAAKLRSSTQKEIEDLKSQHTMALKAMEAEYRKSLAEMNIGSRERIAEKGNETKKAVAGMRPLTGAAASAEEDRKAWRTWNDLGAPAADRAAAYQRIMKNQPGTKYVSQEDPETGAKTQVPVPSKQAIAPPGMDKPTTSVSPSTGGPAATKQDGTPKVNPDGSQKSVPIRVRTISHPTLDGAGFMSVAFVPGQPIALPQTEKGMKNLREMQIATKLILANVEGGMKASQAIDYETGKKSGHGPAFAKMLRSYLDSQGMLEALVPTTSATKQLAQQARAMLPHVNEIEDIIRDLDKKGKLGPAMGRYNSFLTKKWGAGDEEYAKLSSLMGLFTTGMMRAHVGARGGVTLIEQFKQKWDEGKMDAKTLIAGMEGARSFLDTYSKSDKVQVPSKLDQWLDQQLQNTPKRQVQ